VVKKLETKFREFVGCDYAVSTNSGTSALHLAMCALDFKRGDKVICSINVFPSVPESVRHFDAEPIFVDIEGTNYNIDINKLEKALEKNQSKKLKAVIINHMAGEISDLDRISALAKKYKVKVIEDASSAMGAKYKGKSIGNSGADITVFSFAPNLCNSITNGGMMVTNDKKIHDRAELLGFHGMKQKSCDEFGNVNYIYDVVDIGFDYSMSQLDAAYIRAQIKEQDKNLKRLLEISTKYFSELSDVNHITTPQNCSSEHPYSLYIVKVDKNRDSFALELKKEGVEVGLHYIPLHFLTYYKTKYSLKINNFPTALTCYQQFMSLPIYPSMSDEDVDYVIEKVKFVSSTRV